MRAKLIGGCVCAVVLFTSGSWAADMAEASGSVASAAMTTAVAAGAMGHDATINPFIHAKVPSDVREKLQSAVQIAAGRIQELDECSDMFASLGTDGLEMLKTTLYFPARALNRKDGICRRSAAYTTIGGKSTFVCPQFSSLSDERAAMFVVHEALHHAGLSEKPLDRRAMTSLQINAMVSKKCRF